MHRGQPSQHYKRDVIINDFAYFLQNHKESIIPEEYLDESKWIINGVDVVRGYVYVYGQPAIIDSEHKHGFVIKYDPNNRQSTVLDIPNTSDRYKPSDDATERITSFIPIWLGCIYCDTDPSQDVILIQCDTTYTNSFLIAFNHDFSKWRSLYGYESYKETNADITNITGLAYNCNLYGFRSGIGYIRDISVGAMGFVGMSIVSTSNTGETDSTTGYPIWNGKLSIDAFYLCNSCRAIPSTRTVQGDDSALKWNDIVNTDFRFYKCTLAELTNTTIRYVRGVKPVSVLNVTTNKNVNTDVLLYMNILEYNPSDTDAATAKFILDNISISPGSAVDSHRVIICYPNTYVQYEFNTNTERYYPYMRLDPSSTDKSLITYDSNLTNDEIAKIDMRIGCITSHSRYISVSGHAITWVHKTNWNDPVYYVASTKVPLTADESLLYSCRYRLGLDYVDSDGMSDTYSYLVPVICNDAINGTTSTKLYAAVSDSISVVLNGIASAKTIRTFKNWEHLLTIPNCIMHPRLTSSERTRKIAVNRLETKPEMIIFDIITKKVTRIPVSDHINMIDFELPSVLLYSTSHACDRVYTNLLRVEGYIQSNVIEDLLTRVVALEKKLDIYVKTLSE